MSILQDFPSIYQVREKLIENDIITIFATAKSVTTRNEEEANIYGVSMKMICRQLVFTVN